MIDQEVFGNADAGISLHVRHHVLVAVAENVNFERQIDAALFLPHQPRRKIRVLFGLLNVHHGNEVGRERRFPWVNEAQIPREKDSPSFPSEEIIERVVSNANRILMLHAFWG